MIVAVSGHRDIVIDTILTKQVEMFFADFSTKHNNIIILSPLADGADQYIVEIALKYDNVSLEVPLPFEKTDYMETIENRSRFNALLARAQRVFFVPERYAHPYENLGRYLAEHADMLFVLWDGTYNDKIGGTGEVVRYAKTLQKPLVYLKVDRKNV